VGGLRGFTFAPPPPPVARGAPEVPITTQITTSTNGSGSAVDDGSISEFSSLASLDATDQPFIKSIWGEGFE